jgi:hypothetical protein
MDTDARITRGLYRRREGSSCPDGLELLERVTGRGLSRANMVGENAGEGMTTAQMGLAAYTMPVWQDHTQRNSTDEPEQKA